MEKISHKIPHDPTYKFYATTLVISVIAGCIVLALKLIDLSSGIHLVALILYLLVLSIGVGHFITSEVAAFRKSFKGKNNFKLTHTFFERANYGRWTPSAGQPEGLNKL